jgi:hypothetical protein
LFSLKYSLKSRLTLFRLTALPVFLVTVTPSLRLSVLFSSIMTKKCLV